MLELSAYGGSRRNSMRMLWPPARCAARRRILSGKHSGKALPNASCEGGLDCPPHSQSAALPTELPGRVKREKNHDRVCKSRVRRVQYPPEKEDRSRQVLPDREQERPVHHDHEW